MTKSAAAAGVTRANARSAATEIAAAQRGKREWAHCLQSLVDADPQVSEGAQRGIVSDEPVPIAKEALGEPEELNGHDPERERGLVGVLRGAADQPRGRRQQADSREERRGTEQAGQRDPPRLG